MNLTIPQREPVAVIGAVAAAIGATLVVIAHWLPISEQLQTDIKTAFCLWAVALIVLVPIVRAKVTPNSKVVTRTDSVTGDVVAGPANRDMAEGTPVSPATTPTPDPSADLDPATVPEPSA